jgi:hypothetical protein
MGNHDNQAALRGFLLDEAPSTAPLARVRMIDGLGIITVDTSVPGFPHGDISTSQLDWLAEQLATRDRGRHSPDSSSKLAGLCIPIIVSASAGQSHNPRAGRA